MNCPERSIGHFSSFLALSNEEFFIYLSGPDGKNYDSYEKE